MAFVSPLHLTHVQNQFLIFVKYIQTNKPKSKKELMMESSRFQTHPEPHSLGKPLLKNSGFTSP